MSYGSSCLIVVSVGRKEQLLGGERRARSLCHLSAPRQLGSSRSARCSISLCREINWEEAQGEMDQWGDQLGESGRGTGSGQSQGTAASANSGPTAAACRAQPLDVLPLPPPEPRRTGKVRILKFILTLAPSGHGCGWTHPHASCSSCSLLLLHSNNLSRTVWPVSSLPGVCLRLTPGSKDRWTFKGTKRAEWL